MDLTNHFNEISETGVSLVQIAPSGVDHATAFAAEYELPFPIMADEHGDAFAAYGLKEGSFLQLGGPRVMLRAAKAIVTTGPGSTAKGNPRMLPGTAIVDRSGKLRLHQVGKDSSDHMSSKDILRAATQIMTLDNRSISG